MLQLIIKKCDLLKSLFLCKKRLYYFSITWYKNEMMAVNI